MALPPPCSPQHRGASGLVRSWLGNASRGRGPVWLQTLNQLELGSPQLVSHPGPTCCGVAAGTP